MLPQYHSVDCGGLWKCGETAPKQYHHTYSVYYTQCGGSVEAR